MTNRKSAIRPLYPLDNGHAAAVVQGEEVREGREADAQGEIVGPIEGDEAEDDPDELEGRKPRIGRRPNAPTKAEIEEHNPLHVHYRAWCIHCQAGRSTCRQHRRNKEREALGPSISIDYAFKYDDETEEATSPVLVVVDAMTESIWALEVDAKGLDTGAGVEWLVGKLDFAGYSGVKITVRSDQEPSSVALKDALALRRKAETPFF